jgi:hypothetical protein
LVTIKPPIVTGTNLLFSEAGEAAFGATILIADHPVEDTISNPIVAASNKGTIATK